MPGGPRLRRCPTGETGWAENQSLRCHDLLGRPIKAFRGRSPAVPPGSVKRKGHPLAHGGRLVSASRTKFTRPDLLSQRSPSMRIPVGLEALVPVGWRLVPVGLEALVPVGLEALVAGLLHSGRLHLRSSPCGPQGVQVLSGL